MERFPHTLLSRVPGLQCVSLATSTGSMARVTVELPEDVLAAARKCAKHERRGQSAVVCARTRESTLTEWPESLVNLLRHGTGNIVEPDDPPLRDLNLCPECGCARQDTREWRILAPLAARFRVCGHWRAGIGERTRARHEGSDRMPTEGHDRDKFRHSRGDSCFTPG